MKTKKTTSYKKSNLIIYGLIYILSFSVFGLKAVYQASQISNAYGAGVYKQENVNVYRFEMIDCEIVDDLAFNGKGENARLIYNGYIDSIYMDCEFSYGLREFKAYYNTTGDYTFTEEMSMSPKQFDKYLMYDFPNGTKQVKMYYQNSSMSFNEIRLNCRDHTNKYDITMSDLFMLAILPTTIYLIIDYIFSLYNAIKR